MGSAAAFFDLDRTLIRGSANFPLAVAAFRAGYVPPRALLLDAFSAVRFVLKGATDEGSAELRERILGAVAGHPAADVIALGDAFIPKLKAAVLPEARQLLAAGVGDVEDVHDLEPADPAAQSAGRSLVRARGIAAGVVRERAGQLRQHQEAVARSPRRSRRGPGSSPR